MIKRFKRSISLFIACAMFLSLISSGVEAAVATLFTKGQSGRFVEVSIKYDSQSQIKIDTVVLYIDNIVYEKKKLQKPAKQGVVSFDWDTQSFAKGQHYIEARLYANNKLVTAVNGAGVVSNAVFDVDAPVVSLPNVKDNENVSGTKVIRINAKDNSGEAPIVSLLVDKKLKLMQNTQPYQYTLDTTKMTNGKHVIEVYAFDLEGNQSDVVSYTINVNNTNSAVVADASIKTNTIDLNEPKETKRTLASRPTLSNNTNTKVGRISEADVNASVNSVKTTTILAPNSEGVLVSPKMNEEIATKIVLKDPVVASNSNVNVVNSANIKASVNSKSIEMETYTPSIASEPLMVAKLGNNVNNNVEPELRLSTSSKSITVNNINAPKSVTVAPKEVTISNLVIAKKVSDSSVVANELKLATGTKVSEATLDAPKTVTTVKVEPKAEPKGEVLIAKNVTNVSVASNSDVKLNVASATSSSDVASPSVKTTQAPKDETTTIKTVKVTQAPKAEVKCDKNCPKTCPKAEVKCDKNCPKADCPKAEVKCDKNCPKADCPKANCPKAEVKKDVKPVKEPVSLKKAKLRDLVDEQKGTLFWDNKTKTVTAYVNNCKVEMTIGSKKVKVNGNPLTINLVPQLKNGRTIIDVTDFKKISTEAKK